MSRVPVVCPCIKVMMWVILLAFETLLWKHWTSSCFSAERIFEDWGWLMEAPVGWGRQPVAGRRVEGDEGDPRSKCCCKGESLCSCLLSSTCPERKEVNSQSEAFVSNGGWWTSPSRNRDAFLCIFLSDWTVFIWTHSSKMIGFQIVFQIWDDPRERMVRRINCSGMSHSDKANVWSLRTSQLMGSQVTN